MSTFQMPEKVCVAVIGSGGREHEMGEKLLEDPRVAALVYMPGRKAFVQGRSNVHCCLDLSVGKIDGIVEECRRRKIDLVIVGPEAFLAKGGADALRAAGILVVGPALVATKLEASKVFAKEFMARHGIPTAPFFVADNPQQAYKMVERRFDDQIWPEGLVVKADGLADGKAVIVASGRELALEAVENIMVAGPIHDAFPEAGRRVVIEQRLVGVECSVIAVVNVRKGQKPQVKVLLTAKDHKSRFEDGEGPNTGGMGAGCPNLDVSPEVMDQIMRLVVMPTVESMGEEGIEYCGFLYWGLMFTENGPFVLEFNVRMGDPEAQAILPLLESSFLELMWACATRQLDQIQLVWLDAVCMVVVLVSEGYPGKPVTGHPIEGVAEADEIAAACGAKLLVRYCGAELEGDVLKNVGGRALNVGLVGADFNTVLASLYEFLRVIRWPGMGLRKDICRSFLRDNRP